MKFESLESRTLGPPFLEIDYFIFKRCLNDMKLGPIKGLFIYLSNVQNLEKLLSIYTV